LDQARPASDPIPGIALLSFAHSHQRGWAGVFRQDPRVRLVCAWDELPQRGQAASAALEIPFEPSLERVLARPDVQAVTICATNDAHADLAVAAAGAGKHIMMQKPMATTLADCDRIVEAVEGAGVLYYQSHNLRFDPVHQEIKRRVEGNELGRLSLARRRHSHAFALLNPSILEWMSDPRRGGGGAFMDEGAHVALWFLWMFGAPRSVMGMVAPAPPAGGPGSGPGAGEGRVEDTGVLLYRYDGGLIGVHQSSWTELAATTTVELFVDGGVLVASGTDISSSRSAAPGEPPLRIWRPEGDGGHWETPPVQLPASRLSGTAGAFVDLLAPASEGPEQRASPADARTARTAVEMVLAGYQSSREGREVPLPLPR
jgi:predicted dehydrogenase